MRWWIPFVVLTLSFVTAQMGVASDALPMAGEWVLNEELSDSPGERARPERGGRGGRGGGGFGGGPGGGAPRGGGGGGRADGEGRGSGPGPNSTRPGGLEAAEEMRIDGSRETVTIYSGTGDDGQERLLKVDGQETVEETPRGEVATLARWKKDRLVVESNSERGSFKQVYELTGEGQLKVTTEISPSGQRRSITLKRIYDRAPD